MPNTTNVATVPPRRGRRHPTNSATGRRALLVAGAVLLCLIVFGPIAAAAAGSGGPHHGRPSSDTAAAASQPSGRRTCIGIDLGTSYSAAGIYRGGGGGVEIIPNELGARITPSVVAFLDHERLVGDAARAAAPAHPAQTIHAVKRLIGKKYSDATVQADRRALAYAVVDGGDDRAAVRVEFGGASHVYTPEQVSALVLRSMKASAEAHLGRPVDEAVVTVPAYFNDAQRKATITAGRIAGLNVSRVLNEPTAAAIAYGLDRTDGAPATERNVVVYDLGGGTFDVSVLTVDDGFFEVLATGGDTHLGGEDFDNALVQHVVDAARRRHRVELTRDAGAMARVRAAVEAAKRQLSSEPAATVSVEDVVPGVHLRERVTRAEFEELARPLLQKTLAHVQRALDDARLATGAVDDVVLVGGSTRIPLVRALLKRHFGGKEPHGRINPDEAVAYGAAVQAAITCGASAELQGSEGVVLVDITPLSLGLEVAGGVMHRLLPRGSQVPANASEGFTTFEDGQTSVRVKVFEGERAMTKDNRLLGTFELAGIAPQPRGKPVIRVTLSVDANAVLTVHAADEGNPAVRSELTVANSRGELSEADVARMVAEAELFAAEDDAVRAAADARSELEALVQGAAKAAAAAPAASGGGVLAAVEGAQAALDAVGTSFTADAAGRLTRAREALRDALAAAEAARARAERG